MDPLKERAGKIKTVAIPGAGPAASTLAALFARAGVKVAMLHRRRTAPLVVGESLVPASIPMLQMPGVEDEVRDFSTFKPGATFNLSDDVNFSFFFKQLTGTTATYAYNVPRDRFDDALLETARKAGVNILEATANLERIAGTDRLPLNRETLDATGGVFRHRRTCLWTPRVACGCCRSCWEFPVAKADARTRRCSRTWTTRSSTTRATRTQRDWITAGVGGFRCRGACRWAWSSARSICQSSARRRRSITTIY